MIISVGCCGSRRVYLHQKHAQRKYPPLGMAGSGPPLTSKESSFPWFLAYQVFALCLVVIQAQDRTAERPWVSAGPAPGADLGQKVIDRAVKHVWLF